MGFVATFTDAAPTSLPLNLYAQVVTTDSLTIAWQDVATNESSYLVFADAGEAEPVTQQATLNPDSTSWSYTGLESNKPYSF